MDPLTAEQARHTPEQPPRVALLNTDQLLDWIAAERDRRAADDVARRRARHLAQQRAAKARWLGLPDDTTGRSA